MAVALLAYLGVRVLVRDDGVRALADAASLRHVEDVLGIAWERPLQCSLLGEVRLVRLLDWVYICGFWPVLVASAAFLYIRRASVYRRLRTAMIISGSIGLLVFLWFPVAPPRLTDAGICDTVERYELAFRQVARPAGFTNQYAAMPSFHFGWVLLSAVCLASALRRWSLRALVLTYPLLMALAVVVTGNHYILDGLAGGVLALLGLALGGLCSRGRGRRIHGIQGT